MINGRIVTLLGLIAIGYAPMLWLHFRLLWSQPQYQYFPFVIGAAGLLLWSRCKARFQESREYPSKPLSFSVILGACLLKAFATLMYSPWLAMLSAIVLLGAAIRFLKWRFDLVNALGIWGILWLLLPLPLGFDNRLIQALQRLSSQFSSYLLDFMGVLHVMSGNVLRTAEKQFFVDEACSGIVSVMSVIACALIYSVWKNRPLIHMLFNVVIAPVWAMVLNVARISTIGSTHYYWGWDLSVGLPHELLGLALFLATFGALVSTDALMAFTLAPIDWSLITNRPGKLVLWFNSIISWCDPLHRELGSEPDRGSHSN